MQLFYPVKWIQGKDWRLTQGWGGDFLQKGKLFYKSMGFNGHMGLDYAGPQPGVLIPVYAAHAGVVVVAGEESGWGNHIRIQGDGFQTNYAHLSKIWVKEGETVKAMQEIGIIGNSGTSTAVHLHFWLRPIPFNVNNGFKGYIDPTQFMAEWIYDPTELYWQSIPHFFDQYTDNAPVTGLQVRKLIDIALARAGINKIQ